MRGTILGGPAWASEFFAAGDVIVAVDNNFAPEEALLEVLESCDAAESAVTITVQKGGPKVYIPLPPAPGTLFRTSQTHWAAGANGQRHAQQDASVLP